MLTGYKPTNDIPSNEVPSYGSIVSKELGSKNPGFPAYVALPHAGNGMAASYLGVAYNAFETLADPSNEKFSVRNLKLPNGLRSSSSITAWRCSSNSIVCAATRTHRA